ncbi:MAG: L-serine ammonia-lyase, iron-sulfur-dependent, subunit alpha, partial [Bacillota bacterium]
FEKVEEQVVRSLFTAAGVGIMIEAKAFISGAAGGCQAEIGSAACMAAAAGVELMGGSPYEAINAGAIALKNMLGLVCDPVAGLVEVPCIKRNAIGTANALVAIDMSLAGIKSLIPLDEVILAMREVGLSIPISLKETAKGGLANTPCARKLERELNLGIFE